MPIIVAVAPNIIIIISILTATSGSMPIIVAVAPNTHCAHVVALSEKKQVPFSMAIGN